MPPLFSPPHYSSPSQISLLPTLRYVADAAHAFHDARGRFTLCRRFSFAATRGSASAFSLISRDATRIRHYASIAFADAAIDRQRFRHLPSLSDRC